MQDLYAKLEKLLLEAEDCALISQLATDRKKRALFAKLAVQLKGMARDVERAIAVREKADAADRGQPQQSNSGRAL